MRRRWRTWVVLVAGLIGGCVGDAARSVRSVLDPPSYSWLAKPVPLPHHVPKDEGGLTFRFAMAHDVIHERFPKHGRAFYVERDRITRAALAKLAPDDPARFPLEDDLGAGLERLGRTEEAVAVMRAKLARQEKRGLQGLDLYTSYANLGTFLIHGAFAKAMTGDREARARFREGVEFVRRSVKVNPRAHFGREQWQAAVAEFLLAAMDDPKLLVTFDCLGNRLDATIETLLDRELNQNATEYGRAADAWFRREAGRGNLDEYLSLLEGLERTGKIPPKLADYRKHIVKVGAEEGWSRVPSHEKPAPFDEPMLGLIGMWRQGGGANPHFALAFGETMLRVGQRYIAWTAFERASRMAERFWPDPTVRSFLVEHCRVRREQIESTLLYRVDGSRRVPWQVAGPPPPPEFVKKLRARFDAELEHGLSFQREYQAYEEEKIRAGASIEASDFFDAFYEGRPAIASRPGAEEWIPSVPPDVRRAQSRRDSLLFGLWTAGLTAGFVSFTILVIDLLVRLARRGFASPNPTA